MAEYSRQTHDVMPVLPTVIGLGRLVDLIIRDASGQRLRFTPKGEQWLAWKPDTRDLVVLRARRGKGTIVSRRSALRHQAFHGAAPELARPMEWPAPNGSVHTLGLIESVTYVATGIHSPTKGPHHWIHQFGDRGERGHGRTSVHSPSAYAEHSMPYLQADRVGNLFVVRRTGNYFTVKDWIIG